MVERERAGFNSRSRVGSDFVIPFLRRRHGVSIRAPAWGATRNPTATANRTMCFNSRSRVGSDDGIVKIPKPIWSFNSRSRVGSDAKIGANVGRTAVSIRAPAWGATPAVFAVCAGCGVSIRAPAWGATQGDGECRQVLQVSIRAPAWGATKFLYRIFQALLVSIRAPAWGATDRLGALLQMAEVSIRAPAWGATSVISTPAVGLRCFNSRSRVGSDLPSYTRRFAAA